MNTTPMSTLKTPCTSDLVNQKAKLNPTSSKAFAAHLKSAIDEVNKLQFKSEGSAADLVMGQVKDLHQAAMAIGKAEIDMKLMLEIRSKAINAYKELGKTQL